MHCGDVPEGTGELAGNLPAAEAPAWVELLGSCLSATGDVLLSGRYRVLDALQQLRAFTAEGVDVPVFLAPKPVHPPLQAAAAHWQIFYARLAPGQRLRIRIVGGEGRCCAEGWLEAAAGPAPRPWPPSIFRLESCMVFARRYTASGWVLARHPVHHLLVCTGEAGEEASGRGQVVRLVPREKIAGRLKGYQPSPSGFLMRWPRGVTPHPTHTRVLYIGADAVAVDMLDGWPPEAFAGG